MALQKQSLSLNFAKGLDTKTDKWQVNPGNFLLLENSVFTVGGQLTKRNGFDQLTSLPSDAHATALNTHNGNLVAFGNSLYAYNNSSKVWQNKGTIPPVSLSTTPVVRTSFSNTAPDACVAPNGLVCSVFQDGDGSYKYTINTADTGESIVAITNLPATSTQARTFFLAGYFLITYLVTASGVPHLQFIAIPAVNPTNPGTPVDISTLVASLTAGYDAVMANNTLFVAHANSTGGINVTYINSALAVASAVTLAGHTATLMSLTADVTGSNFAIYITAYAATNAFTYAISSTLATILAATQTITGETVVELTSTAQNGVLTLFYEVNTVYSYASIRTDIIRTVTCTKTGSVGSPSTIARSVGLGSKAFLLNGISYMVAAYGGPQSQNSLEPTDFLIDGTGAVISRFATANGGGYATTQVLPSVTLQGNVAYISYLLRDLIQAISRTDTSSQAGFYSQTGVNLMAFNLSQTAQNAVEIGGTLCITGGFLWMYDGIKPVEQGFHLYPENVLATPATSGGTMTAQQYYYQVVYEWTDGNGNGHRSAPSIPVGALTTTGASQVALNIPTLRLTYKTAPNAVRIVIYRWSTAQQTYYQITSVTSPTVNTLTGDSVAYVDTVPDTSIVGNNILYTAGGVIENLPGPACDVLALFDNRVWAVTAEDRNLLWFSKQVIEATPVEMSDLLTVYVAPTTGAQGSTGLLTAIAPMDDKLILFKPNALAYLNGAGPDNTGSNNQYSQPIFITSTIGTRVPKSIVFQPQGLVFDTDQGRWLLARGLSTEYVGAPVAQFNDIPAVAAINVPGQNQIRITLPDTTLVYNYFYGQWGTFVGIPAISSTLFQGMHTYLQSSGKVFQESATNYQDGSEPVLMAFRTGWFNLAGLQGFERSYFFFLLGKYLSPHKLNVSIAYDYNESDSQSMLIAPTNYAPAYGSDAAYGASSPYGGPGNVEWWRVHLNQQKCTAFRITVQEVFDYSYGFTAGPGFTLSGLNLVFGIKGSFPRLSAAQSIS